MRFRDDLELRRRVAEEAARAAAEVHFRYRGHQLDRTVHEGDRSDYATRVDFEAQAAVSATVQKHFPHERVIGEEDESFDGLEQLMDAGCWFTDPLDGTLEYVHDSPAYSCIVSYVEAGTPQACAVYFPAWGEMYSAAAGMGATLNAALIRVSGEQRLSAALFGTAYRGTQPERAEAFARRFAKLAPHIEGFRLPGPPSVMACAVAAGRYDLYAMIGLRVGPHPSRPFSGQPWETCAFILLVREAGGSVASAAGGDAEPLGRNVYAASQSLLDQYFEVMGSE